MADGAADPPHVPRTQVPGGVAGTGPLRDQGRSILRRVLG